MRTPPAPIRQDYDARGVSRVTRAPCPGTCRGDTLQIGGECIECHEVQKFKPVQHGRGLLHVRRGK